MIRFIIEGDMNTGVVKLNGPTEEPRVWRWLLGEAERMCQHATDEARAAAGKGPQLVVAHTMPGEPT